MIPKILLVDDRPENLLALEGTLAVLDVECHRATSGPQALNLALDHEYALILLDEVLLYDRALGAAEVDLLWGNGSGLPPGPVVLDASEQPIMMHSVGLEHRVSSSWIHSDFENSGVSPYDIALTASASPRLALRHGSHLEFIEPNAEGYWIYTEIDDMDSATVSVGVDTSDDTHACYVKDGALWFY